MSDCQPNYKLAWVVNNNNNNKCGQQRKTESRGEQKAGTLKDSVRFNFRSTTRELMSNVRDAFECKFNGAEILF